MGYTVTFKSNKNKTVVIDIDGGGTALTPQGFQTVESEDADIFAPVRSVTGTISVLADNSDLLSTIVPLSSTSKSVVAKVDGVIVFRGFLQANAYSQDYVGFAHGVELPCNGMIETLRNVDFDYEDYLSTPYISLGDMMSELFGMFNNVAFVKCDEIDAVWDSALFNIYNLLTEKDEDDIFDGKQYQAMNCYAVLEEICKYFGITAREKGNAIYLYMPDANAATSTVTTFSFDGASDQQSYVDGKRNVKVTTTVNAEKEEVLDLDFYDMYYTGVSGKVTKTIDGSSYTFRTYVMRHPYIEGLKVDASNFINNFVNTPTQAEYKSSVEIINTAKADSNILTHDYPDKSEEKVLIIPTVPDSYSAFSLFNFKSKAPRSVAASNKMALVIEMSYEIMKDAVNATDNDYAISIPIVIKMGDKYLVYSNEGMSRTARWEDSSGFCRLVVRNIDGDNRSVYKNGVFNPNEQDSFTAYLDRNYGLPDGAIYTLPQEAISGKISVGVSTPTRNGTDAKFIKVTSLSVKLMRSVIQADALSKTYSRNENKYSYYVGKGREDYEMSSIFTTAVGMEAGKGVVLGDDGNPYTDFANGKCAEENTLDRLKAFYNHSHSVLNLGIETNTALTPLDTVSVKGKKYAVCAVANDYLNDHSRLTLIEV